MRDNRQLAIVTGGAGFIGSEVVAQLATAGHRVIVLDNLVNGRPENVEGLPHVELIPADIRDVKRFEPELRRARVIYHLACLGVRHSLHAPEENHEVNARGTLMLLLAARAAGVPRFVHVSSSEVYGTASSVPMTEDHPTYPRTVYGASKLAGECYARAFHETYGYPTVVVRPFNAYGPRCHHEGDSGEVIPKFLLRALAGQPLLVFGDGTQTRDFTHVSDSARAIIAAGECDAAVGHTLNVGSGSEISIMALARTVLDVTGRRDVEILQDAPRPGDVLRLFADSSRAREMLGFQPRVGLAQGLAGLVEWYLSRPLSPAALLHEEVPHNWLEAVAG